MNDWALLHHPALCDPEIAWSRAQIQPTNQLGSFSRLVEKSNFEAPSARLAPSNGIFGLLAAAFQMKFGVWLVSVGVI